MPLDTPLPPSPQAARLVEARLALVFAASGAKASGDAVGHRLYMDAADAARALLRAMREAHAAVSRLPPGDAAREAALAALEGRAAGAADLVAGEG